MKKRFGILLFTIIAILFVHTTAAALTDGDWEYEISNNEVIITGYKGIGGDVRVPETLRNCPVVEINGLRPESKDNGERFTNGELMQIAQKINALTLHEGIKRLSLPAEEGFDLSNLKQIQLKSK